MNKTILLVEDEESINRAVALKLTKEGYIVHTAAAITQAANLYHAQRPQLIICDIGLPDGSGLDFCAHIRRDDNNVIFLFLTAFDTEPDILNGYEAGADDYIIKPFSLSVLVSKVNAVMKRCSADSKTQQISSGDIILLPKENRAQKGGEYLPLTANEQKLLTYLMENPLCIISKNQLLAAIWDIDENFVDDNTVAVNIRRLRAKIEDNPSDPVYIKNVRGLGYIWDKECVKS